MDVSFKITGMEELKKGLSDLAQKEFPYAMAKSLTRTAQDVQTAEVEEMKRVFDRPTPWTLNSVYIVPAKKDNLMATVWLKDDATYINYAGAVAGGNVGKSGTPASKFLWPEIFGGDRHLKRFEKALQYAGILPPGMYCVPGQGAELDAYGNIKSGLIIQLISYFKGFADVGYKANITEEGKAKLKRGTKKKRGYEYFAVTKTGAHLKPGIYRRVGFAWGSAIKPILMFVRKPSYRPRLDFFGVGNKVGEQMLPRNFDLALEDALRNTKF